MSESKTNIERVGLFPPEIQKEVTKLAKIVEDTEVDDAAEILWKGYMF